VLFKVPPDGQDGLSRVIRKIVRKLSRALNEEATKLELVEAPTAGNVFSTDLPRQFKVIAKKGKLVGLCRQNI
jgi:hypothetical protein